MEAIARLAGVSKGTLYNFFPSKQDLFMETVLASYQDFVVLLPTVEDPAADPRERLDALIESLAVAFDALANHQLLAHQAWSVILQSDDARSRLLERVQAFYAEWVEGLHDIVSAGIERGLFRDDVDLDVFAHTWIAVYDGLIYRAGLNEPDPEGPCSTAGVRSALGLLVEHITRPAARIPDPKTNPKRPHSPEAP